MRAPGLVRRLAIQSQQAGDPGRLASERLGRGSVERPAGPLIWCHFPGEIRTLALASLTERLDEDLPGVTMLATSDSADLQTPPEASPLICHRAPEDLRGPIQRFLEHWRPDAGIWFDRVGAPLLLEAAARGGMPLFLQDAAAPDYPSQRRGAIDRRLLGLFERILTVDAAESGAIRALGAIPARIETTGRLRPVAQPPTCIESERDTLASAIASRPVWLASCPTPAELDAVLTAHQFARRTAHRLLLIIVPPKDVLGAEWSSDLQLQGWAIARRDADEDPDDATDIFIADCREEIGLFYRVSPITFLGGTLSGGEVPSPMEPATLGSAIIAGPHAAPHGSELRRLRRASAFRYIASPEELGGAVSELLAPDKAARLALNAWDVASDGSQVLDRLAGLVVASLRDKAA